MTHSVCRYYSTPFVICLLGSPLEGHLSRDHPMRPWRPGGIGAAPSSGGAPSIKREAPHALPSPPDAKRLSTTSASTSASRRGDLPDDLVDLVAKARSLMLADNLHEASHLVASAVRHLSLSLSVSSRLSSYISSSLCIIAREHPALFRSPIVMPTLLALLGRDALSPLHMRSSTWLPALACNLLMTSLKDETTWPRVLFTLFLDDLFGERMWVDHPEARDFVANILTALPTPPSIEQGVTQGVTQSGHVGSVVQSTTSSLPSSQASSVTSSVASSVTSSQASSVQGSHGTTQGTQQVPLQTGVQTATQTATQTGVQSSVQSTVHPSLPSIVPLTVYH